ncbi:LOW QUALITY PROTEIN: hypothetical protein V1477_012046 [Vespula maculifrons]|uniref:Uncharacterized protein n=1 Tax=Vespula maculifrons TaxID=7453 RepID=A0ABD2C0X6_VESMC
MLLRVTSAEALNTYVQVEFVRVLVSKAPSNIEEEGEEEEGEEEEEEKEEELIQLSVVREQDQQSYSRDA